MSGLPVRKFDALVVGAGGAGMRASLQLAEAGRKGVAPMIDDASWKAIRKAQGRVWRPQLRDEYRRGVIGPKTWRLFTGHA